MSSSQGTIPVSVYRQLASELQATRAMLEAVQKHNAQLTQQRDRLRSDLDALAEAVATLRANATPQDAPRPIDPSPLPVTPPPVTPAAPPPLTALYPPAPAATPIAGDPFQAAQGWNSLPDLEPVDQLYGGPDGPGATPLGGFSNFGRSPAGESSSGLWPIVAIALIAATAFGISFALVRPILSNKQEQFQPVQPQIQPGGSPSAAPASPR
ncbi:MAG: hypothetical protein EA001_01495 [Oscillatoriales cyanobacterium]|nr:MAG: hypothetical protein EA001_01495 [Oscillatoriales cyanobacterium]